MPLVPPHDAEDPAGATSPAGGGRRTACWDLPAEPSIVRKARELTRTTLLGWGHPRLIGDVVLMVDELVANAVTHGRPPIRLSLRLEPRPAPGHAVVVGEVTDGDPRLPEVREADHLGEGGRGLWIVRHLADEFGVRPTPQGKAVWFALAVHAGPSGERPGR